MLKHLFLTVMLLHSVGSFAAEVSVFINHDDGGKTSQRHLNKFLSHLQNAGCPVVAVKEGKQPNLLFDPAPRSIAVDTHPEYQLIAKAKTLSGKTEVRSAIVVQASTGVKDIELLKGNWIGFISKQSWVGYHLPRKLLSDAGVNEENSPFYFVGNYIGAAAGLGHRDIQVAILAEPLAKRWAEVNNLGIVAVTDAIETGGWWVQKSLSEDLVSQCTKALVQLKRSQHKVVPAYIDGFEAVN